MKSVMLITFLLSQMLCIETEAKEEKRPQYERTEPFGTEIIHNEIPLQAYELGEYKELALLITDYHELWKYSLSLEAEIASLKREINSLNNKALLWETTAKSEKEYAMIWQAAYKEERNLRLSFEDGVRKTKWVPWAVVVAESILIVVLSFSK